MEEKTVQERIEETLRSTKRKGIDALIENMEERGFFEAPCSGGNHLCCEGGLAVHSWNVYVLMRREAHMMYDPDFKKNDPLLSSLDENNTSISLSPEELAKLDISVAVVALLHDLGKCGDHGLERYIPNLLKSGKISASKPYKQNPMLLNVPHAVMSGIIARQFIDLTPQEEFAIIAHDGMYGEMRIIVQGHETPLMLLVHHADMLASRILEVAGEESDGEDG